MCFASLPGSREPPDIFAQFLKLAKDMHRIVCTSVPITSSPQGGVKGLSLTILLVNLFDLGSLTQKQI